MRNSGDSSPPIPGFDCLAMKHEVQSRIYDQVKGMTDEQLIEYFARAGREFRETGIIPTQVEGPPLGSK